MPLKLDVDVPFGNACDVSVAEAAGAAEVSFAADPHGGPECLWFCFRLVQTQRREGTPRKVRLILKHAGNVLGGGNPERFRPVARAAKGDWERLGVPEVEELPDGRRLVVWTVDEPEEPEDRLDVAFCYPYGREDVDALLRETKGYWRADTIGVSQSARPLVRLSNTPGEIGGTRPGLYVAARQHSGETPGSWVLDGFLRHIATLGERAPLVWAVPLTNIDGVEQGDYGKDNFPYDLNRAWGRPPMRHETLVFQRDVAKWKERCRPAFAIDFHAPGGDESDGVYCYLANPREFPRMNEVSAKWAEAIAAELGPACASPRFGRVADYASRWESPGMAKFFHATHQLPAISIETSYIGCGELVFTREHYREAGTRIARAVAAFAQSETTGLA